MAWLAELIDFQLFFVAALLFVPLERLLAANRAQPALRRLWTLDLVYVFANGIVIRLGLVAVVAALMAASPLLVPGTIRAAIAAQPVWLQAIEVVLLADLGLYWAHRAFHAVPALWRIHQIHHSIEDMDWLAAHRVHPIDQVLTKAASFLPVFALGYSELAIAIFGLTFHFQALLVHANIRLGYGPLDALVVSPNFHHWHHSRESAAWDKNFAAQFSLWDRLFGTYYLPRARKADRFGIEDQLPETYGAQLLYPFRRKTGALRPPGSAAARGTG